MSLGKLLERLLQLLPVLLGVSLIVFVMMTLTPGDPVQIMIGDQAITPEQEAAIRHDMGLDRPIHERFFVFLGNAVQGDFGQSFYHRRPVSDVIVERLPATIELSLVALIVAAEDILMNNRAKLADLAKTIRSKNAGTDKITFDIIFREKATYELVKRSRALTRQSVCDVLNLDPARLTDFVEYDPGNAIKFTILRERPSGSPGDADIFGAQQYAPFLDVEVDLTA